MDAAELRRRLEPVQNRQGFFFNPDAALVTDLLEALLVNRDRYGYMCCPCRLAAADAERDRDIICPCVYRRPDVEEYGQCYCGLYVREGWTPADAPEEPVPERRPAGKSG